MDESNFLIDLLSESLITQRQYDELDEASDGLIRKEASVRTIWEEAWLRVANNIRKDTQKYQKLMDVLKSNERMSLVVSMLENKFGHCADCGKNLSRNMNGSLHGHKCKENISFTYKGDECILPWKGHSFELKFESGSLSRSVSEVIIDISTKSPEEISLPEDSILVSDIFTVQCKHEFLKSMSLKMEHSAEDCSNLCFATISGQNPTFTLNWSGKFDERYGNIQTKNCSCFSIVYTHRNSSNEPLLNRPNLNPEFKCHAALYSKCVRKGYWEIYLYIVKNTDIAVLANIERDKQLTLQGSAPGKIEYQVDDVMMDISLTPKEIEDGWTLPSCIEGEMHISGGEMHISGGDVIKLNEIRPVVSFNIHSTSNVSLDHAYNLRGAKFNSLCLTLHHTEDSDSSDQIIFNMQEMMKSLGYQNAYKCFGLPIEAVHSKGINGEHVKIAIIDSYDIKWDSDILTKHNALMRNGQLKVNLIIKSDNERSKRTCGSHDSHALQCTAIAVGEKFADGTCKGYPNKKCKYAGGVAPEAEATLFLVNGKDERQEALRDVLDGDFDVLSMSFGSTDSKYSDYLTRIKDKTLIVAAAGNSGNRLCSYPAESKDVISVGALNMLLKIAPYSRQDETVDIFYLGELMVPWSDATGNKLRFVGGTSMAAPGIAGMICLLIQCAKKHDIRDQLTKDNILKLLKKMIIGPDCNGYFVWKHEFLIEAFDSKITFERVIQ